MPSAKSHTGPGAAPKAESPPLTATASSPTGRLKYITRSTSTGSLASTRVEWPETAEPMATFTSRVRLCCAATAKLVVRVAPSSTPKVTVIEASASPGFKSVRYSWNPGRVEPSAKVQARRGPSAPSTPCAPLARTKEKA